MVINNSVPLRDGFHMPAEFEKHAGTIMIWPVRPGSWPNGGVAAKKVFARLAGIIAKHEKMYMLSILNMLKKFRSIFCQIVILRSHQILKIIFM